MQILDILDGTGSGDVDISRCIEASPGDSITGIYANDLKLNPEWTNPTGLSTSKLRGQYATDDLASG